MFSIFFLWHCAGYENHDHNNMDELACGSTSAGPRGMSMMQEDHEASSVEDILKEAVLNRHQILYLNYKCLTEFPEVLYSAVRQDGQSLYDHVERLYLKRNLLETLVRMGRCQLCWF